MRKTTTLALMAVGAAVLVVAGSGQARAVDYPWCIQGGEQGYPGLCYYQTYEQCRASASGRLVGCGLNPRFYGQSQQPLPQPRRGRPAYPN